MGSSVTAMTTHGDDIGDRALARPDQLRQHPDRQRRLLAGGEGGDDDLVEGQRKGEHAAGKERRADVGRTTWRKVWKPSAPRSIEASIRSAGGAAEAARRRCCRPRRCRRWRGRARSSRTRKRDVHEVEGRAQRDAGDDAGQRDRQDEQQRDRLAAEEPGPRQRRGGTACRAPARCAVATAATLTDKRSAAQMSGRVPGDGEPLRGEPRRREDDSSSPRW